MNDGQFKMILNGIYVIIFFIGSINVASSEQLTGIPRETCSYRLGKVMQPVDEHKERLSLLREQMTIRATLQGPEIDAYIIPAYDEHQTEEVADADRRLQYLTGFTGTNGLAAVTQKGSAFWTDERYLQQANSELTCDWEIFLMKDKVTITTWLLSQLSRDTRVGADPHLIPHFMWIQWITDLYLQKSITLVKINNNLIDVIWGVNRPPPPSTRIRVHKTLFAGEKWESKITTLRTTLKELDIEAMVVTSLTEIAYMLNIRGRDIPYTPVIQAYLIVTQKDVILYTNQTRVDLSIKTHLKSEPCHHEMCVQVRDYKAIWRELLTFTQFWKSVLIPSHCVYDLGASEAVHAALSAKNIIVEKISPIIFMRAQKNGVERAGMRQAHIRDGAAMCDVMSFLEEEFNHGARWSELKLKLEVERSRNSQQNCEGLSFSTIIAFGPHGAQPHYIPSNATDILVTDQSTLIIDSGGQYLDGTTDVTRTYHFGQPTAEQKKAYTNVLAGIIRLATLKFPSNLIPSEIDALSRSPVWDEMSDYPHGSGHGIGSYLSVHESPIDISYSAKQKYLFKDGYFFSNEPGYYKKGSYGIRLENVLEVVDTGRNHPSGARFLALEQITLVPFEPKLIDRTLLRAQEKRWLNEYNAKIRTLVGAELKNQGNMYAFYWMMNKTRHIREYLPENEYYGSSCYIQLNFSIILLITFYQIYLIL